MQTAFLFNPSRCTACYTCVIACCDLHDIQEGESAFRRIITEETGRYPSVRVTHTSLSCRHCKTPACVANCPAEAIVKRAEDGIVVVSTTLCSGRHTCGICAEVCPYGAPQFSATPPYRMQKCDLCVERFSRGKKPVCVEACPMRALEADFVENE